MRTLRLIYLCATLGSLSSARWVLDYEREEARNERA